MPQSKQKAPKVGEMVHYIARDPSTPHQCFAAVVSEVYKNDPDAAETPGANFRDYERLNTIQVRPFHARAGGITGTAAYLETEYSADGHRGTWHPINACPLEA